MADKLPPYIKIILSLILIVALTIPLSILGFILGIIGAYFIMTRL